MILRISLFLILTAAISNQLLHAQNFTFRAVALEGQPAPRTGGTFSTFVPPRVELNDSNAIAFFATMTGSSARQGIFLLSQGTLSAIALEGDDAPGGGKFVSFFNYALNRLGNVAFMAGSTGGSGIFLYSHGQISLVTQTQFIGCPAGLGVPGSLSLNDNDDIAFASRCPGLSNADEQIRVFLISTGNISLVAPNSTAPSLNNRGEIAFVRQIYDNAGRSFVSVGVLLFSNGAILPIAAGEFGDLNDRGDIVITVDSTRMSRIDLFTNGSISTIVPTAQRSLSIARVNNSRYIAFAEEEQRIVNSPFRYNRLVLFDGTKFSRISDGEAPGTAGGRFSGFGPPALNNFGALAFIGYVTGGNVNSGIFLATPAQNEKLYFAQFGDGSQSGTSIFSQITLINLDSAAPANVSIEINDDNGSPLTVDLNGAVIPGRKELAIPANGAVTLKTDGQGPIQAGSVTVSSDRKISGVILFGGNAGTAGVGDSKSLKKFVAPLEIGQGINTGVALMGLGQDQLIQLELRDEKGNLVAKGTVNLGAKSHLAKFITELQWDGSPNLANFSGTLTASGTASLAATVIRVSPGQFTTLPVAEKN